MSEQVAMTVEQAIEFARVWQKGLTVYPGAMGWRVVCMVLADEVERLKRLIDSKQRPAITDPVAWRRFDGEGGYDYTSDSDIALEWMENERGKLPKFVDALGLATFPPIDPVEDHFSMRELQHIMITSQGWDRAQGIAFADGWTQCAYHYGIRKPRTITEANQIEGGE